MEPVDVPARPAHSTNEHLRGELRLRLRQRVTVRAWLVDVYSRGLACAAVRGAESALAGRLPNTALALVGRFLSIPREWTAVYFGERSF